MADTEKITINMDVVNLGQIDLLVEQGFYSNRTDFIKAAIRAQLSNHSEEIKKSISKKVLDIGVICLDKKYLETKVEKNEVLDIKSVGMLILKDDITPELAQKSIRSLKVYGVLKANEKLKEALRDRIEA